MNSSTSTEMQPYLFLSQDLYIEYLQVKYFYSKTTLNEWSTNSHKLWIRDSQTVDKES